jgi:type IV pilus assembly protein PilB
MQITPGENLIEYVDQLIQRAIQQNASDIHFEPYEHYYRIRFRQDGILHEVEKWTPTVAKQLTARLKILAALDIAEQRLPQDGHFQIEEEKQKQYRIDVRISTCPTLYGEKIVLRLLNQNQFIRSMDDLGFQDTQKTDFIEAIQKPQGLILVTGPTGSGKTVTLYAALSFLNSVQKNISTVEDPVEIYLPGINQVNVNTKNGLTFATVLRSFLRQDPNIMMIGEIRDAETAEIAIKAAQTGHLVLATLHTNHSYEALTRLQYMGIAPYYLAETLLLITAQRLARKLCDHCKTEQNLSTPIRQKLNLLHDKIYMPTGCPHCLQGYRGRIAIHEVLTLHTHKLSDRLSMLSPKNPTTWLQKNIQQKNKLTLQQSALLKLKAKETSLDEIYRVIRF